MSCLGKVRLERRWWGSRCGCTPIGYGVDEVLGLDATFTRTLQEQFCRLCADVSFDKAREHLEALRGVSVSKEALRRACHRQGRKLASWQKTEESTPKAFAAAQGEMEFTVDAGKVLTLEEGWKDLKIAVFQKRPLGERATPQEWAGRMLPEPTARVAWAGIAPIKHFRRSWRKWSQRLGVAQASKLHVLADGAEWIWKAADRVFTGSQQTLDIYHGCEHLAKAGERLYGEGKEESTQFLQRGRALLLEKGWTGICQLVADEYVKEDTQERRKILEKLVGYFIKHKNRLDYSERLKAGQAIGSGSVEGWAKTLGLRFKARGARWRRKNVSAMSALVCVRNGGQWPAYWLPAA